MTLTKLLWHLRSRCAVSALLFASWTFSLGMRVSTFDHPTGLISEYGLDILATGWLGVLGGSYAWYANPLFFLSLTLVVAGRSWLKVGQLLTLSLCIIVLTWNAFSYRAIWDDAGIYPIVSRGAGFWVWIGTMVATGLWLQALAACRFIEVRNTRLQASL